LDEPAAGLSQGERSGLLQLLSGRALMIEPRFLVLGEISEGLAPIVVAQLIETLKQLAADGIGMLIVEQRLAVAAALSNRLAIMVNGRIALETTSEAMLADLAHGLGLGLVVRAFFRQAPRVNARRSPSSVRAPRPSAGR
jgi:branched-chain amino acid transport system ATP-binding protein